MIREFLVGLSLLLVVAVGGVLLFSEPADRSLVDPFVSGEVDSPGEVGPGLKVTELGGAGSRSSIEPELDPALDSDPDAVVGQVFGPSGRPIDRARVVFAHKQFGGAALGWSYQGVIRAGRGADAEGRFRLVIEDGKRDDLAVIAVAPGCVPTRVSGVDAGDVIEVRLTEQFFVPGTVLAPDGMPARGVPVELFDPRGRVDGLPTVATTDENGRFRLRTPGEGSYSLRVSSALGGEYREDSLTINDPAEPIQIRLRGEIAIQLTLRDIDGSAVSGARFSLRRSRKESVLTASSNEDGVIRASGLALGSWEARVEAEGFAPLQRDLEYQGGILIEDWTLERYASLRARVINGKQRALPGAELRLIPDPGESFGADATQTQASDLEGLALFERVVPGRYVLTPEHQPGHNPTQLFELREGESIAEDDPMAILIEFGGGDQLERELVLRRHGFLNVTVTQDGRPVVGARGSMTRGIANKRTEVAALDLSDLQGLLVFPSVWMGEYEVEIQGAPDQLPIRRTMKFGRGGNKRDIELPMGALSGRVIGADGPAPGALVFAAPYGGKLRQLTTTDGQGRFELSGLEAASYHLRIELDGATPWVQENFQHPGGKLDLGQIEIGLTYTLEGQVENLPAADSLFGSLLSISDRNGRVVKTLTLSSDGNFQVDGLPAGVYTIEIFEGRSRIHQQRVELPNELESLKIYIP
ncbi:MAG: carboxypeptidase regulatory-like domain-containing protein [Planctomycetes bacterium]|nr:carboxypeptidase regulatory-like domain-containing protein [Planctomycetota bacterium]